MAQCCSRLYLMFFGKLKLENQSLSKKCCFSRDFASTDKIFIFNFLEVIRQLLRELIYTSLLEIITLRFACGEKKIASTIKKSQNIMNMIVDKFSIIDKKSYFNIFSSSGFEKKVSLIVIHAFGFIKVSPI